MPADPGDLDRLLDRGVPGLLEAVVGPVGRDGPPGPQGRLLFLADRNKLVDDPKDKDFAPSGDARRRIEGGNGVRGREMSLAIHQALAEDANRPGLDGE